MTFMTSIGPVDIDWTDDDRCVVYTADPNPQLIGSVDFTHVEDDIEDYWLVTNMHLEGPDNCRNYLGKGIGRECIRIAGSMMPVTFAQDDGHTRSDGAHLTGMGVGFAQKMISEGLAFWEP